MRYSKNNNSNEIGASVEDERALLAFLELIKEGYSLEEIPIKLDSKIPPQTLRRIAKKKNMWFSKEELEEFKKQKKEKDAQEAQRLKEERVQKAREEIIKKREQREKNKQEYLKEIEQRKEAKRIREQEADKLRSSTSKTIEEFRQEREIETKKRQESLAKQRQEAAEQKEKAKELKKKERKSSDLYSSLVKSAKSEDSLEYKDLEEGEVMPTKARRELIDYLSTLNGIHLKIGEKATELIVNTLYLYPDMANKGILKFLILNASRDGGYESAMEMTEELLNALKETKYEKNLNFYKQWAQKQINISKIKEMKDKGLSNTQIGEKLRISSAEVMVLLHSNEEKQVPEFEEK